MVFPLLRFYCVKPLASPSGMTKRLALLHSVLLEAG